MFGRLAAIRVRAAEDAFAEGRLEDAVEIAAARELESQSRIQDLRLRLAQALLERGQEHLMARRFAQAAADFDRAHRCGALTEKVAEWRARARAALDEQNATEARQAAALAEARRRIEAGSLIAAGHVLDEALPHHPQRAILEDEIESRARRATACLDQARTALSRDDLKTAIEKLHEARKNHARHEGADALIAEIAERALTQATQYFISGRIELAGRQLSELGDLADGRAPIHDLSEAIKLAREAAAAIREDRFARAAVLVGRLAMVAPAAEWLVQARRQLDELESHRRAVLQGPLGLMLGGDVPSALADRLIQGDETMAAANQPAARGAVAPPPLARDGSRDAAVPPIPGLPRRLLLRIDGVGSFLLIRGDRISIGRGGPAASASTADLPLIADISERQAEIVRSGEDYFIVSPSGVELAGAPVDHALLRSGDRIRLGKRVRLTFNRPSLKSTAAMLDLGDGVRSLTDCRRVILWSGPILMGGTRECHVALPGPAGDFVVTERGNRIYVKPMGPGGSATPVTLGEQMTIGSVRFRVLDFAAASGPGRVYG